MKAQIVTILLAALQQLINKNEIELADGIPEIQIDRTRDQAHGDFASNIALVLAKKVGMAPRNLAQAIVENIPENELITQIDIAGPGFINFFVEQSLQNNVIKTILEQTSNYGFSESAKGKTALLEFVSANPTGPLHVGHGRGAAYGDVVANLLTSIGYKVDREYYVNDAGRQMDILAVSVYLRYLERCDKKIHFPKQCYQGDYILDIANTLFQEHNNTWDKAINIPDWNEEQAEQQLDELIENTKDALGNEYLTLHSLALNTVLDEIKTDLNNFGVEFDRWYSEASLNDNDLIQTTIKALEQTDYIYEDKGAKWFRSSALGDEKDRVVVRDNGIGTYFASDIAYHKEKFDRGYDKIIDIWGADHHGYIPRVRAAMQALNYDQEDKLEVLLVQFVSLYRGKEKMQMSTRSGQFVTLETLRDEVGKDATRFFYVMRKSEQHLDFDLELATSNTKENPVYYIQYAHARICRLLEKVNNENIVFDQTQALNHINQLTSEKEQLLLTQLASYPEVIEKAAMQYEPHQLVYFLKDLATSFHTWYDTHRVLNIETETQNARLCLCLAVKQTILNGLSILGVSAPESM